MERKYVTIEEAARELELSPRQVHRRVLALFRQAAGNLDGHLRRGPRGAWLLDREIVELLRRVEDYRQTAGIVVNEALQRALDEWQRNGKNGCGKDGAKSWQPTGNVAGNVNTDALLQELKGVRAEVRWLFALCLVEFLLLVLVLASRS